MAHQENINYRRIEQAITFIQENFKDQPSLDEIAASVHLSPFHFQRLFSEWAGVSPKKFIQYLSLEYAKALLKNNNVSLLEAACETGLSGPSRLHDMFITIEGMTPGEFKSGGKGLAINFSFAESPFGKIFIASTLKGICHMFFIEDEGRALNYSKQQFPNATYHSSVDKFQQNAVHIFQKKVQDLGQIKLHLAGTPFQLKVWESLLKIPMGSLTSYGEIGKAIEMPKATRAIGTAIGRNPVAFLIPCHRVIQAGGKIGGYMWGPARKSAMIGWEAARRGE